MSAELPTVCIMGNPVLQRVAEEVVNIYAPETQSLVDLMEKVMRARNGAGLAAPQIGVSQRIIIVEVKQNPRYPYAEPVPKTILINPTFKVLSHEQTERWEGCLSVPGIRGLVPRYEHIEYSGYTEKGEHLTRQVQGFHARVFQHEYDHLNGVLFLERVLHPRNIVHESEMSLTDQGYQNQAIYRMPFERIVSGGQTGVDRAALDFSIEFNIPHGGFCPRGRLSEESFPIPLHYKLIETTSAEYAERTQLNVENSDATLIVTGSLPLNKSSGTFLTVELAKSLGKPFLVMNLANLGDLLRTCAWLDEHSVKTLNVSGPQESQSPGIYEKIRVILKDIFRLKTRKNLGSSNQSISSIQSLN